MQVHRVIVSNLCARNAFDSWDGDVPCNMNQNQVKYDWDHQRAGDSPNYWQQRTYWLRGHPVIGVAHNMPSVLFGAQGDTPWNLERPKRATKDFFQATSDTREVVLEESFRALREDGREKAHSRYVEEVQEGDRP